LEDEVSKEPTPRWTYFVNIELNAREYGWKDNGIGGRLARTVDDSLMRRFNFERNRSDLRSMRGGAQAFWCEMLAFSALLRRYVSATFSSETG
jgi:hypothetical protein